MFCRKKSLSRQHRVGQVLSLNTWPRSRTWLASFLLRWARSWSISSNHIARWMSSMKNWRRFWLRRDDFWVSPRQPPKNLEVNWTSSQGRLAWKLTHWTVVAMKVERQPLRISRKLLFPMERKSQRYNNNEFMNIAKPMWWVLSIYFYGACSFDVLGFYWVRLLQKYLWTDVRESHWKYRARQQGMGLSNC